MEGVTRQQWCFGVDLVQGVLDCWHDSTVEVFLAKGHCQRYVQRTRLVFRWFARELFVCIKGSSSRDARVNFKIRPKARGVHIFFCGDNLGCSQPAKSDRWEYTQTYQQHWTQRHYSIKAARKYNFAELAKSPTRSYTASERVLELVQRWGDACACYNNIIS